MLEVATYTLVIVLFVITLATTATALIISDCEGNVSYDANCSAVALVSSANCVVSIQNPAEVVINGTLNNVSVAIDGATTCNTTLVPLTTTLSTSMTNSTITFLPWSRGLVTLGGTLTGTSVTIGTSGPSPSSAAVSILGASFGSSTTVTVHAGSSTGAIVVVSGLSSTFVAVDGQCTALSILGSIASSTITAVGMGSVEGAGTSVSASSVLAEDSAAACNSAVTLAMSSLSLTNAVLRFVPNLRGEVSLLGAVTSSAITIGASSSTASSGAATLSLSGSGAPSSVAATMGSGTLTLLRIGSTSITALAGGSSCFTVSLAGTLVSSQLTVYGARLVSGTSASIVSSTLKVVESAATCATAAGLALGGGVASTSSTITFLPWSRGLVTLGGTLTGTSVTIGTSGPSPSSAAVSILGKEIERSSISVLGSGVGVMEIQAETIRDSALAVDRMQLMLLWENVTISYSNISLTSLSPSSQLNFTSMRHGTLSIDNLLDGDDLAQLTDTTVFVNMTVRIRLSPNCTRCPNLTLAGGRWIGGSEVTSMVVQRHVVCIDGLQETTLRHVQSCGLVLSGSIANVLANVTTNSDTRTDWNGGGCREYDVASPGAVLSSSIVHLSVNSTDNITSFPGIHVDSSSITLTASNCRLCNPVACNGGSLQNSSLRLQIPGRLLLNGCGARSTIAATSAYASISGVFSNGSTTHISSSNGLNMSWDAMEFVGANGYFVAQNGIESLLEHPMQGFAATSSNLSVSGNTTSPTSHNTSWFFVNGSAVVSSWITMQLAGLSMNASDMRGAGTTWDLKCAALVTSGIWENVTVDVVLVDTNGGIEVGYLIMNSPRLAYSVLRLSASDANRVAGALNCALVRSTLQISASTCNGGYASCETLVINGTRMNHSSVVLEAPSSPVVVEALQGGSVVQGACRTFRLSGNVSDTNVMFTVVPQRTDVNPVRFETKQLSGSKVEITTPNANSFEDVLGSEMFNSTVLLTATNSTCLDPELCLTLIIRGTYVVSSVLALVANGSNVVVDGLSEESVLDLSCKHVNMSGVFQGATLTILAASTTVWNMSTSNVTLGIGNGTLRVNGPLLGTALSVLMSKRHSSEMRVLHLNGSQLHRSSVVLDAPADHLELTGMSNASLVGGMVLSFNISDSIDSATVDLTASLSSRMAPKFVNSSSMTINITGQDSPFSVNGLLSNSSLQVSSISACSVEATTTLLDSYAAISAKSFTLLHGAVVSNSHLVLEVQDGAIELYASGGVSNSTIALNSGTHSPVYDVRMYGGVDANVSIVGKARTFTMVPFNYAPLFRSVAEYNGLLVSLIVESWAPLIAVPNAATGQATWSHSAINVTVLGDMIGELTMSNVALVNSSIKMSTGSSSVLQSLVPTKMLLAEWLMSNGSSFEMVKNVSPSPLRLSISGLSVASSSISATNTNGTISGSVYSTSLLHGSRMSLIATSKTDAYVPSADTTLSIHGGAFHSSEVILLLPLAALASVVLTNLGINTSVTVLSAGSVSCSGTFEPLSSLVARPSSGFMSSARLREVNLTVEGVSDSTLSVTMHGAWDQAHVVISECASELRLRPQSSIMTKRYWLQPNMTASLLRINGVVRHVTQDAECSAPGYVALSTLVEVTFNEVSLLVAAWTPVLFIRPSSLTNGSTIQITSTSIFLNITNVPQEAPYGLQNEVSNSSQLSFVGLLLAPETSENSTRIEVNSFAFQVVAVAPRGAYATQIVGLLLSAAFWDDNNTAPNMNIASRSGAFVRAKDLTFRLATHNVSTVGMCIIGGTNHTMTTISNATVLSSCDLSASSSNLRMQHVGVLYTTIPHRGVTRTTHYLQNTTNVTYTESLCSNVSVTTVFQCSAPVAALPNVSDCSLSGSSPVPANSSTSRCRCTALLCTSVELLADCQCTVNGTVLGNPEVHRFTVLNCSAINGTGGRTEIMWDGTFEVDAVHTVRVCSNATRWTLNTTNYTRIDSAAVLKRPTVVGCNLSMSNIFVDLNTTSSSNAGSVSIQRAMMHDSMAVGVASPGTLINSSIAVVSSSLQHTAHASMNEGRLPLLETMPYASGAGFSITDVDGFLDCVLSIRHCSIVVKSSSRPPSITYDLAAVRCVDGLSLVDNVAASSQLYVLNSSLTVWNATTLDSPNDALISAASTVGVYMRDWTGMSNLLLNSTFFYNVSTAIAFVNSSFVAFVMDRFEVWQGGSRMEGTSGARSGIVVCNNLTGLAIPNDANALLTMSNGVMHLLSSAAVVRAVTPMFVEDLYRTNTTTHAITKATALLRGVRVLGGGGVFLSEAPFTISPSTASHTSFEDGELHCTAGNSSVWRSWHNGLNHDTLYVARSAISGCTFLAAWANTGGPSERTGDISWACNRWNGQYLSRSTIGKLLPSVDALSYGQKADDINCRTFSRSSTTSVDLSRSRTVSASNTPSMSYSYSASAIFTSSPSVSQSQTESYSTTKASLSQLESDSVTLDMTFSKDPSATRNVSTSVTLSTTSSDTTSLSSSASMSPSFTTSSTTSKSATTTNSDSLSVTIDPCNTTFRSDSSDFIRNIQVLDGDTAGALRNNFSSTFLTIDRVSFAVAQRIRVQIGFNTYIRNFYYNTSMQWFPLPQVTNCEASEYELVNATDFVVALRYNPSVSLHQGVTDDYYCNLTFSTDIFQCQLMTNFTFNFSATMLITGTPQVFSPLVKALSGISSSVVSFLTGGAALLQQSRAETLLQFASCQFSIVEEMSPQDSPTQYGFGSEGQYYHRGCVVGNLSLILGFSALVFVVAAVVSTVSRHDVEIVSRTHAEVAEQSASVPQGFSGPSLLQQLDEADQPKDGSSLLASLLPATNTGPIGELPNGTSPDDSEDDSKFETIATRRESYKEALQRICGRLAFPSVACLPSFLLIDGTIVSSTSLVVHPIDSDDPTIGIVGLVFYFVVFVICLVVTLTQVKRQPTRTRLPRGHLLASRSLIARRIRWLLTPSFEYPPLHRRQKYKYAMMSCLFEESKYAAFICCDLALSMLLSALLGVGISDRSVCFKLAIASFVGFLLFFAVVVYLRPNVSRLSLWLNVTGAFLGLVAATATVVSMGSGTPILGEVTQVLSMVLLIMSILQITATCIGVAAWIREAFSIARGNVAHAQKRHRRFIRLVEDGKCRDVETGSSSDDCLEEVDPVLLEKDRKKNLHSQPVEVPMPLEVACDALSFGSDFAGPMDDGMIELLEIGSATTSAPKINEATQSTSTKPPSPRGSEILLPADFLDEDGNHVLREPRGPRLLDRVTDFGAELLGSFHWPGRGTNGKKSRNAVSELFRDIKQKVRPMSLLDFVLSRGDGDESDVASQSTRVMDNDSVRLGASTTMDQL